MKIKYIAIALLAGIFLQSAALCQTNADANGVSSPAADAPVPATASNTVGAVAGDMPMSEATNGSLAVATNPAPSEATNAVVPESTNSLAPEVTNNLPLALAPSNSAPTAEPTNETSAATSTEGQSASSAAVTNAPIQFADTPITAAIELLARTAGVNYLLDPKIAYGQTGANGQVKQEPTISAHWDNVTPQQALLALLDNYGLELVENPKTHIAIITLKSPDALPPLITRVIQLKYASTSNMIFAVESSLTDKRSRIVQDVRTSQLVVIATDPEQSAIDTLIAELDKPTRQVLIETRLVELSSNPQTQKGIDWSGTLQAQNIAFGNGTLSQTSSKTETTTPGGTITTPLPGGGSLTTTTSGGTSTSGATTTTSQSGGGLAGFALNTANGLNPATGFLTADGVSAVLSFLNKSQEAQVVSTPRVVTLDNEMATISVTRQFPVINVTASTQNTTGGSSITYSNIGTILEVTPRITANDYIWLKVVPDVSSFFGVDTEQIGPGQTIQADIFDSRHIETQVLIPNAHTLVMGGLVQDNPNALYTKVPILGDIPGLGWAFRSESKSLNKDNLLIFITPTIVKDADFHPMKTDFLQSEPRVMADPMDPHSWWDSGEPKGNWSNPLTPGQTAQTTVLPKEPRN